jgi:hypothetical protein
MGKNLFLILFTGLIFSGCWDWQRRPGYEPYKKVWGYKPVFSTDSTLLRVQSEAPRTMKHPGKIYVKDNLVFQNDIGYGIHIIDNSVPSQAHPVGFIRIWGSSEISIKGNYLYTNSYDALVVADVTDWQQVREIKRVPHAFRQSFQAGQQGIVFIPLPEHGVYYDCMSLYSPGKIQTGWVRDSILNHCYFK